MAVKIRLQRHGKKNFAFFHIVVADARSPRDGRYIEQIGSYNPNTNPATIVLNSERALAWLNVGAEPTLVARRILSYEAFSSRSTLKAVLPRELSHRSRLTRNSLTGKHRKMLRSRLRSRDLQRLLLTRPRLLQMLRLK